MGEENGVILFNYNPTSAVHYNSTPTVACNDFGQCSATNDSLLRKKRKVPSSSDSDEDNSDASNPPIPQDRYLNGRSYDSPELDLDDDSQRHYYGYSDDSCSRCSDNGSSSSSDEDDTEDDVLRYGPSEFDTELTTDQMNEEAEIFTRAQLTQMTLDHLPKSATKEDAKLSTSTQNFYASGPESDSEGEQSKHEIESSPPPPPIPPQLRHNNTTPTPDQTKSVEPDDAVVPPQFSRSTVGGSKAQPTAHPNAFEPDDLIFESRFESGNLGRAIKITPTYYELYLRPDMYTNRHTQWFYFRVKNTKAKTVYRFSIINLTKPDSLYKEGMRPLMYSTLDAEYNHLGWQRCGENIAYFRNDNDNGYNHSNYHHRPLDDDDDEFVGNASFTLSFNIEFRYDDDTVFFAHSYPYTYSDLQDYLMGIQRNPVKSKFCKLRLLCRSLAGNNVYYLTVTAPSAHDDDNQKKKKAVIISARVHPGESPASWMMKGLMDFITGDSYVAKKLRHKFIFKIVPMLNPDGVIVGNTRSSLTGRDLNRQYRTVIRETYPSIWNTKAMIRRLMEDCGVAMYCDMHAHSRKHNVFIYGCENLKRHPDRRLLEQVFPLMLHKNVADKFSFENCKFKVQKNKEGTGRIVVWVLGVTNSYTLEASFGGSTMGGRAGTHFSTADYEHIGRAYCETLMDYYDDNPIKRPYHKRARQCLKFILNLANPDSTPPSEEAIERRMAHFRSVPVPRCKEEREARRIEQGPRKRIVRRVIKVTRHVVREPAAPEEFKCSLIFDSLYQ